MTILQRQFRIGAALAGALLACSTAAAQVSELMRFDTTDHAVSSCVREGGPGPVINEQGEKNLTNRFSTVARSPGVNMIRVHFDAYDLGERSEIQLISLDDGAMQRFTHEMLTEWGGWSAIFNGDAVMIQLLVAPGEEVWFEIDEIATNNPVLEAHGIDGLITSICGSDNRVASSDSRVGRLSGPNCGDGGGCGGCTAWLTSVGSAVTAGHCGTGSGGLIEFNVPQSAANGAPVAANPNDQYPVGVTWYAFQDGGQGLDWAIMSVGPNANTGLRAHWVQGYFHLSPGNPADDTILRITGCGVDNLPTGSQPFSCCATNDDGDCTHFGCNSSSLTLQTSTGPKTDDNTNRLFYRVDTEPANSGSPIIWNNTGFAIGVHTHGGCTSGGGENSGTRLTQSVMAEFFDNFINNATFADPVEISFIQVGSALFPARTLPIAANLAPNGGTVAMAGGNYTAAAGNTGVITKALTIQAVSGNVVIGN